MARPIDPDRRARTLAAATDYVLEHGLSGLSLRPLAGALGTSTRMLLYDFESKEELVMAVLAEVRRREGALLSRHLDTRLTPASDLVRILWHWLGADERAPFLKLFFEVYVAAMTRPENYSDRGRAMVTDWLDELGARFEDSPGDPAATASATLLIAVLRGLLLDRLNTADKERTDAALELFAQLLAASETHAAAGPRRPGARRADSPPAPSLERREGRDGRSGEAAPSTARAQARDR
jgi:AcrR family transcriptional regulator